VSRLVRVSRRLGLAPLASRFIGLASSITFRTIIPLLASFVRLASCVSLAVLVLCAPPHCERLAFASPPARGLAFAAKARLAERLAFATMEGHAGPFFHDKGTLCAADRDAIFKATGVSAAIRERARWEGKRGLTLTGPVSRLEEAKEMADKIIRDTAGSEKKQPEAAPADDAARSERLKHTSRVQKWAQEVGPGSETKANSARGNSKGSASAAASADRKWPIAGGALEQDMWRIASAAATASAQHVLLHAQQQKAWEQEQTMQQQRAWQQQQQQQQAWQEQQQQQAWQEQPKNWAGAAPPAPSPPQGAAEAIPKGTKPKAPPCSMVPNATTARSASTGLPLSKPPAASTSSSDSLDASSSGSSSKSSPPRSRSPSAAPAPAANPKKKQKTDDDGNAATPRVKTCHFASIGRLQQQERSVDVLTHEHGIRADQFVLVNVEAFPQIGRRDENKGHAGFHEAIWEQLVNNERVLKDVYAQLYEKLNYYIARDVEEIWIVFECAYGKHRSVAMAEIAQRLFQQWATCNTTSAMHYSKYKWSRSKCGWAPCECNAMNYSKRRSLAKAEKVLMDAFNLSCV